MQEIKAPRINGWLTLDSYFEKRLGTSFFTQDDLYEQGIIDVANEGINDKFWILSGDGERIALFKSQQDIRQSYAELISEEVCKMLEMKTACYDLAVFDGKYGVISYNFMKDFDFYEAGFDIIADFYENNLLGNIENSELYQVDDSYDPIGIVTKKLNNLEDIWTILEEKYKDYPNKHQVVFGIVNQLVNVLLFDILMVNTDRHCDNWGIGTQGDKVIVAPQFDNERVLGLHESGLCSLKNKALLFRVDNSSYYNSLEVLRHFLDISSSEYQDLVKEKITLLQNGIDNIPSLIEEKTEHPMPVGIKEYFLSTMYQHLENVNDVVEGKNKSYK